MFGNTFVKSGGGGPQTYGTHGLALTVPAGTTLFMSIFSTGFLAGLSANPIYKDGTIKNFVARVGLGTQPASGALTFTLNVNGVATALVCTVPANGPGGEYRSLNKFAYTAGDLIRIDVRNFAVAASIPVGMVTFDL